MSDDVRERAWAAHLRTKRSHRQARRSSFNAGYDAALVAIADHDGLVDVLRGHSRLGNWECGCGGCHLYAGEPERRRDAFAAHLADVVRAWLRGETA